jgi:flagellar biosynthesis protein FlgN
MSLTSQQQQFEQILLAEEQQAGTLAALLEQEQESLARREVDSLVQLVAEKEKQLVELDRLAAERASLLQQAGYSPDRDGFLALLNADQSSRLSNLWSNVETLLKRCRYQNEVNGKMLDIGQIQTRQLLALLLGRENGGNELYDQNGNASTSYGQNHAFRV